MDLCPKTRHLQRDATDADADAADAADADADAADAVAAAAYNIL